MKVENCGKKVTSLVPTTEGSQLQVEEGNANYANFRGCVSLGFAGFVEFAVEKKRFPILN